MSPKFQFVFVHGLEQHGSKEPADSITQIIEMCHERINFAEADKDVVVAYVYDGASQYTIIGTIMLTESGLAFV